MERLEELKDKGWSYSIGWSRDFKGYLCRVWKEREKPLKVKTMGGKDIHLFTECYSGLAQNIDAAIQESIDKMQLGDGYWFRGLPIVPRTESK